LSPDLVKATTDGVVREPSALGITTGSPPSMTAMTELVVPRSIPTVLGICQLVLRMGWIGFRVVTLILFPASGVAKPRSPSASVGGHLRARSCRQDCRRGRRRAWPAPVLPPRLRVGPDTHARLREVADPGPRPSPRADARGPADRSALGAWLD